MSRDRLRNEYRSLWEIELKRRDFFSQAIGLPITLITGLGGAGFFLIRDLQHPLGAHALFQLVFVLACWLCLVVAIFWLIRIVFAHDYYLPATAKSLEEYGSQLRAHYSATEAANAASEIDKELMEHLESQYIADGDRNSQSNERRGRELQSCKKWIVFALSAVTVAGIAKATERLSAPKLVEDIRAVFTDKGMSDER